MPEFLAFKKFGGGGIRTHDTLITYTRFPSVLLRPLGHSSIEIILSLVGPGFLSVKVKGVRIILQPRSATYFMGVVRTEIF